MNLQKYRLKSLKSIETLSLSTLFSILIFLEYDNGYKILNYSNNEGTWLTARAIHEAYMCSKLRLHTANHRTGMYIFLGLSL
jgi:hypothetical protein